jgi:hypothetical protein
VILVVLMPAKRATEPELMYLCTRMPRYNINAHHAPIATVPVFRTLRGGTLMQAIDVVCSHWRAEGRQGSTHSSSGSPEVDEWGKLS